MDVVSQQQFSVSQAHRSLLLLPPPLMTRCTMYDVMTAIGQTHWKMDAQALLRINAEEDHFLPVEIKVRMLMEQAAMRMRASAMVGERISKLDDVIRVRALLAIIREKIGATDGQPSRDSGTTSSRSSSISSSISSSTTEERGDSSPDSKDENSEGPAPVEAEEVTSSVTAIDRCPLPSEEDLAMFTRMAVSSTKVVLFQLAQEGEVDGAKDVFDVYEGLLTTSALSRAAAEGFPSMNVDSLMSPRHSCYRRLLAARHRFLVSLQQDRVYECV